MYIDALEGYMAMQLGTIDGFASAIVVYGDLKHYEVAPYFNMPPMMGIGIGEYLMNPKVYEALPADLQAILHNSSDLQFYEHLFTPQVPIPGYYASKILNGIKEAGNPMEIVEWDAEAQAKFSEVGLQMLDEKGQETPRTADMVNMIKNVMKVRGYID